MRLFLWLRDFISKKTRRKRNKLDYSYFWTVYYNIAWVYQKLSWLDDWRVFLDKCINTLTKLPQFRYVNSVKSKNHIKKISLIGEMSINVDTNEISKVRFRDELWIDSGEISLEIELINHQKGTKVDLQNELWKFYLYL